MMTTPQHPLVADYLDRLRTEAARLSAVEARDLEDDIRAHFSAALGDEPTESRVRETIERLGQPVELVDAAGGDRDRTAPGAAPTSRPVEGAAIVLLLGAAVLFFVWPLSIPLWIVGLVLVAVARRWDGRHKVWAALALGSALPVAWAVVGGAGLAAWSVTQCVQDAGGAEVCTGSGGSPWIAGIAFVLTASYVALVVHTVARLIRALGQTRSSEG